MSHLTAAISEQGVKELLAGLIDTFTFEREDSTDGDTFSFSYEVALHLDSGDVELTNHNSIVLSEIDIIWDKLIGRLAIDFEERCVGDICIPFTDVCLPGVCIFEADPDLELEIDLAPIIRRSEISGELEPDVRFFVNPDRPPDMDYIEAQQEDDEGNNLADKWRLHVKPLFLDADPIDFADVIGDLLEDALEALVDAALSGVPGPVRDAILAILGAFTDLIRAALDIVDDIDEFFSELFNVSFGLIDLILTAVAKRFADDTPVLELDNPLQILAAVKEDPDDPEVVPLIPVKIPIENLTAIVEPDELVVTAEVGADL
jgi:hypothetical protein